VTGRRFARPEQFGRGAGKIGQPAELGQHDAPDGLPARTGQRGSAGLGCFAEAFTVVFDQDIKPEPFHERPAVFAQLARVHRVGREPVPARRTRPGVPGPTP
jgi:hypothetical protein